VSPEDVAMMADVRKKIHVPLIADESVYTLQDATTLARLEAADVFSIYVGKAGGIGSAKKIADFAQNAGLKCTVGSNLELGVGSAAMVHLAMATRGINAEEFPCDIIGPFYYQDDIVQQSLPITPGTAKPNDLPGLGVGLDDEKIAKYRVE
jgi:L-alanine-DL-glutamate epimerase-like enolase superfamily enzyme